MTFSFSKWVEYTGKTNHSNVSAATFLQVSNYRYIRETRLSRLTYSENSSGEVLTYLLTHFVEIMYKKTYSIANSLAKGYTCKRNCLT